MIEKILFDFRMQEFCQGLIALAYSLKSSAKADVKFHDKARLYARRALLWNLISVIFIALFFIMVWIICDCPSNAIDFFFFLRFLFSFITLIKRFVFTNLYRIQHLSCLIPMP